MKTFEILKILKNNEKPVSGNEIGSNLGISRMAVNKHIKKLQSLGYKIECKQNYGYLLFDDDTLNAYELKYQLEKKGVTNIENIIYKPTESTNTDAVKESLTATRNALIAAPYQLGGKGRKNRVFVSNEGGGYFSLLLKPDNFPVSKSMMMTMIVAVSVAEALRKNGIDVKIKWPNDIIHNGLKLCGILSEAKSSGEMIDSFIIGIGININNDIEEIKDIATSLKMITGQTVKRGELIADIINEIFNLITLFERDKKSLAELYKSYSYTINQDVNVILNDSSYEAKAIGINDDGFLIVQRDGKNDIVLSGDVTIRNKK